MAPSSPARAQRTERRPMVVVVEDDPQMRDLLVQVLADEGFDTVPLGNGLALLARCALGRDHVDLIVTDFALPGFNALEALAELRARGIGIACILVSAFADDQLVEEAARLGVTRVLSKPLVLGELVRMVRDLVDVLRDGRRPSGPDAEPAIR